MAEQRAANVYDEMVAVFVTVDSSARAQMESDRKLSGFASWASIMLYVFGALLSLAGKLAGSGHSEGSLLPAE